MNTTENALSSFCEVRDNSVSSLIPLVTRIARKFRRNAWSEPDREDMAQQGFVGLLEAAGRFDPDRGCSLSTFGSRRAAGAMMDHVRTLARKAREAPTDELPQAGVPVGFEKPCSMESGVMILRFKRFLGKGLLDGLDEVEANVIKMRFFDGKTVRQVGAVLGISPATVVRVERRALVNLRELFVDSACGPNIVERGNHQSADFEDIMSSLAT